MRTSADWYARNPGKREEHRARTYANNRIKRIAETIAWQRANPEKVNAKNSKWVKANPGKANARTALRRAKLKQAIPPWLTVEQLQKMKDTYEIARLMGADWEVDHIHPLQHKLLCGLHVPWNLRIIRKRANRRKSNKVRKLTWKIEK